MSVGNEARRPAGEGDCHTARMHVFEESDSGIVCAEQHVVQEGLGGLCGGFPSEPRSSTKPHYDRLRIHNHQHRQPPVQARRKKQRT